jgi:hypothetical protein
MPGQRPVWDWVHVRTRLGAALPCTCVPFGGVIIYPVIGSSMINAPDGAFET